MAEENRDQTAVKNSNNSPSQPAESVKSPETGNSSPVGLSGIQQPNKNSFQLDPNDQKKISNKKWIHWGLLFIPIGLIITLVIIVWAFAFNNDDSPVGPIVQDIKQTDSTAAKSEVKLAEIESSDDASEMSEYFASVSGSWVPNYINNVPDIAAKSYTKYVNAPKEGKKEAARVFFTYLNNPGVEKTDQYKAFLNDVKADLELTVGESLFR